MIKDLNIGPGELNYVDKHDEPLTATEVQERWAELEANWPPDPRQVAVEMLVEHIYKDILKSFNNNKGD